MKFLKYLINNVFMLLVFHQVLYSSTYLNSIVKYLLQKETKYQLSCDFLKKFLITDLNRSIVINWLIKLQVRVFLTMFFKFNLIAHNLITDYVENKFILVFILFMIERSKRGLKCVNHAGYTLLNTQSSLLYRVPQFSNADT